MDDAGFSIGPAPASQFEANITAAVAELNQKYMVANETGRAVIYAPSFDPILRRKTFDRMSFDDLRKLYLNHVVAVGDDEKGNPIYKGVADIWLRHRDRRQFINGVTFDPSTTESRDGVLNLWEGFAVQHQLGDWSLMRDHIRATICCGNADHFNYFIAWCARAVQHPDQQGETAIVLKGGEGVGKGVVARAMRHIFGQHGMAIAHAKHLVGNFNVHLRDCIFLFADEAFFAGDRAHVGVLKAIITEPTIAIEAKHQNAIDAPNFLHLMMASNEDWVVPASLDSRRFFVLVVDEANKDNHDYFAQILDQMKNGGYEAMLHDLLHYDLTGFNVRAVPVTDGLQHQRKLSLGADLAWWLDVLQRGYIFRSKLGLEAEFMTWHEEVSTEILFASYTEFAQQRHERHPMSRETFGAFMRKLGAKPKRLLNKPVGEHLTDELNAFGGTTRRSAPVNHPRPPGFTLGTIKAARQVFSNISGLQIEWDGDGNPDTLTESNEP
jgi:hypothetical protein